MKNSSLLNNKFFLISVFTCFVSISIMIFLASAGLLPDWYWEFGSPYIENGVRAVRDIVRWISGV